MSRRRTRSSLPKETPSSERICTDKASGATSQRAALDRALDQLRKGDSLVVWKLDRLGRSLSHLVELVNDLKERGIGFSSLQESIDTTSGVGKLVFHLFASLAEFERDLIRERTMAGLNSARARGRLSGRPKVMDAKKAAMARWMHRSKDTPVKEICSTLGISRTTFYRCLNDADEAA